MGIMVKKLAGLDNINKIARKYNSRATVLTFKFLYYVRQTP